MFLIIGCSIFLFFNFLSAQLSVSDTTSPDYIFQKTHQENIYNCTGVEEINETCEKIGERTIIDEQTNISYYVGDSGVKSQVPYESFLNESNKFGWVFNETNVKANFSNEGKTFDDNIYFMINSTQSYTKSINNPEMLERPLGTRTWIRNQIGRMEIRFINRYISFEEVFDKWNNLYYYNTTEENVTICLEFNETAMECIKNGTELQNITRTIQKDIGFSMIGKAGNWIINFMNIYDLDPTFTDDIDTDWSSGTLVNMSTEGTGVGANLTSNNLNVTGSFLSQIFDSKDNSANWRNFTMWVEYPYGEEMDSGTSDDLWFNKTGMILNMHFNNDSILGENDTHVRDFSNQGNNGTVGNGARVNTTDCKFGNCFSFDGDNDYIAVGSAPLFTDYPFTVCAWFNSEDISNRQTIFSIADAASTNRYWRLQLAGDIGGDPVRFIASDAGVFFLLDTTTGYSINTWHHACMVSASSSDHSIYIDAGSKAISTTDVTPQLLDLTSIGRFEGSTKSAYMNGLIDEVIIFNRSLSDDEIKNLYQRGNARLNVSVRSCNDGACSGESFINISNNATQGRVYGFPSSIINNRYFQYALNYTIDNSSTINLIRVNNASIDYLDVSPPDIDFDTITPANDTTTANTSIEINVSITEPNLDEFKWNWNGTNYTIMNDSLVLFMNFDNVSALGENDTHVVDLSGFGNNGTVDGMVNTTGRYGGAFEFSGSQKKVDITTSNSLNFTDNFTISLWINPTTISVTDMAISRGGTGGSGDDDIFFKYETTGGSSAKNRFIVKNITGTVAIITSPGVYNTNEWIHLVGRYNGTQITLFENGQSIGDADLVGLLQTNGEIWRIGSGNENGETFDGLIDEVRIYNRALSAEEVYILYASNLNKYDTNKWAFYINQSLNATDGLPDGTYLYSASAKDETGNANKTIDRTITIGAVGGANNLVDVTQGVSTSPNIDRRGDSKRVIPSSFSLSSILKRLGSILRKSSNSISFIGITDRISSLTQLVSQSFNIDALSIRISSFIQSVIQTLSIGTFIIQFLFGLRTPQQDIGITDDIGSQISGTRTIPQSITIDSIINRILLGLRNPQQDISLTESTERDRFVDRGISQSLTLDSIINRLLFGFRTTTQDISLTESTERDRFVDRGISQSITLDSIINRILFGLRTPKQDISLTDSVDPKISGTRTIPQSITIDSIINRLLLGLRNIRQDIIITDEINVINISGVQKYSRKVTQPFNINTIIQRIIILTRKNSQTLSIDSIINRLLLGLRIPKQDISLTDSTDSQLTGTRQTTQAITIDSIINRLLLGLRTSPQTINIGDGVDPKISGTRTIPQSITIDSIINRILLGLRNPQQDISLTESTERDRFVDRGISQAITIDSIINRLLLGLRTSPQTINIGDSVDPKISGTRGISQAITIDSIINRLLLGFRITTQDISLTDTVNATYINIGNQFSRQTTQSITIDSIINRILLGLRNPQQDISPTDTVDPQIFGTRQTIQSLTLDSIINRLLFGFRTTTQDISLTESTERDRFVDRGISQAITIDSIINRLLLGLRTSPQTINIGDSVDPKISGTRGISQAITIDSIINRLLLGFRITTQDISLTDTVNATYINIGTITLRTITQKISTDSIINRIFLGLRSPSNSFSISDIIKRILDLITPTPTIVGGGGGGGGITPFIKQLNKTVCNSSYFHLLDFGNEYFEIPRLQKHLNETYNIQISIFDLKNDYLNSFQDNCGILLNYTLKPDIVCKEIVNLVGSSNYVIIPEELDELRENLKPSIDVSLPVLTFYINNFNKRCSPFVTKRLDLRTFTLIDAIKEEKERSDIIYILLLVLLILFILDWGFKKRRLSNSLKEKVKDNYKNIDSFMNRSVK